MTGRGDGNVNVVSSVRVQGMLPDAPTRTPRGDASTRTGTRRARAHVALTLGGLAGPSGRGTRSDPSDLLGPALRHTPREANVAPAGPLGDALVETIARSPSAGRSFVPYVVVGSAPVAAPARSPSASAASVPKARSSSSAEVCTMRTSHTALLTTSRGTDPRS